MHFQPHSSRAVSIDVSASAARKTASGRCESGGASKVSTGRVAQVAGGHCATPREPATLHSGHHQAWLAWLQSHAPWLYAPHTRPFFTTRPQRCAPRRHLPLVLHLSLWYAGQSCVPSFIWVTTSLACASPFVWCPSPSGCCFACGGCPCG